MADNGTKEMESMIGYAQELSDALTTLSTAMLKSADDGKAWTIMSRFTSGSSFWKIQNKIRGIVSSWIMLNETQEAGAKAMAEYNKLLGTYSKLRKKVPKELGDIETIKKSKEFQDKQGMYRKAFGSKGDHMLINDLKKENKKLNQGLDKLESKLAKQLQYSKWSFKERMQDRVKRLKAWWKQSKFYKKFGGQGFVKGTRLFVKAGAKLFMKALLYFMGIAVVAAILMLFLRKGLKWFNTFAEKSNLWETGAKFLSAIWEIMSGVFQIMEGIWKGDFLMVLGAFWHKILPGIGKLLYHGFMFSMKLLGALFSGLVGGFFDAIYTLGVQIENWIKERSPKAWAGRQWDKVNPAPAFRAMRRGNFRTGASGMVAGENVLVGEAGPEIVTLPMGARVHSDSDSRRMGGNTIHVHVNGRVGASDMEIRDIADKVAREINLRMNRTGSVAGRF